MNSKKVVFSKGFEKILLTSEGELPVTESNVTNQWHLLDEISHFSNNEDGKLVCSALAKAWEFMPGSAPPYLITKPINNKVVFFGGSFNPWHAGHQQCLEQLNQYQNTFIIPDNNPLKPSSLNPDQCVWSRYQELKSKVISPVHIYPGFWTSNKANPTANWIPEIKKNNPELKIGLLIGFDSFMSIHQWIEAKKLLSALDDLFIVSRLDNEVSKLSQIKYFEKNFPDIHLSFLGHHQYENISSTQLRDHS